MGRLGRGALWVTMPAVGLASSLRHRRKEREHREDVILEKLDQATAAPPNEHANEVALRRDEINRRFKAAGLTGSKRDQARAQLAHLTAGEGMTVSDALDAIAPPT